MSLDHKIVESWQHNARAWSAAVREGQIESRRLGTDAAVMAAILAFSPRRVLDAGCGEGWLARQLSERGVQVTGFDGSEPLVEEAQQLGGGTFIHLTYEDFISQPSSAGTSFDVVSFNFSLFTADVVPTLRAARSITSAIVIQTIHPFNDAEGHPYADGWRVENFQSMGPQFATPMPWYFRTMQTWINSVTSAGFHSIQLQEPLHPETARPLSLLITGTS